MLDGGQLFESLIIFCIIWLDPRVLDQLVKLFTVLSQILAFIPALTPTLIPMPNDNLSQAKNEKFVSVAHHVTKSVFAHNF